MNLDADQARDLPDKRIMPGCIGKNHGPVSGMEFIRRKRNSYLLGKMSAGNHPAFLRSICYGNYAFLPGMRGTGGQYMQT